jgi:YHS domain-containing protein
MSSCGFGSSQQSRVLYFTLRKGEAMEKDVVCQMTVETDTAATSEYRGKKYYFCSAACKSKFDAAPDSYIED